MKLEHLKEANRIASQLQKVDIQEFILKNQKRYSSEMLKLIADQYIARKKAISKLPSWFANAEIIFPAPLSVEQSSSEKTATFKATLIPQKAQGIDLTGGMGIDTLHFAKASESVIYVEKNPELFQISTYNFQQLNQENIKAYEADSVEFLKNSTEKFDWIYLDPARRDSAQNKVFRIEDCEPNLLEINDLLLEKSSHILVKFSPLLDIKLAINQLKFVHEVFVVSVENEVKELLFSLKNTPHEPFIHTINFSDKKPIQSFHFTFETEENLEVTYSLSGNYLYEPNASIMKAGAFKSVADSYKIQKISPNSHLYISDNLIENFAGRVFKILKIAKFDKQEILAYLPDNQANISTRNFPMKPEEIKKKLGLKDGGNQYLFATETANRQKVILICDKVS